MAFILESEERIMPAVNVNQQRLVQQCLVQNQLAAPEDVVAWLGAVQSQEYMGAKWSLALRMQHPNDAAIEQAFNDGRILRTHILRPTWHFVAPADIRWMLALTAPRINMMSGYQYRQMELDEMLFARSNDIIVRALQGGKHLTRAELGAILKQAGIIAEGLRLTHIVFRAELDAVICSGPRHGKQFTYALLEERAPQARLLPRDEALAELTRRYFMGHAPATVHDFAWWSGLTVADAKAGLAMIAADFTHEIVNGQTYYFPKAMPAAPASANAAFLLPTFDELMVGYDGFDVVRKGGRETAEAFIFESSLVMGGSVIGSWRRTLKPKVVEVEIAPFAPLSADEDAAVTAAIQRYGDFVGLPVSLKS
jgi:hypothetical protein